MTMICVPCGNVVALGWWGPDHQGTHCRECHRSWSGLAECHCLRCHEHFGSPSAADLHDPSGVCQKPDQTARKDGTPALAVQQRRDGPVWVAWSADASFFERVRS